MESGEEKEKLHRLEDIKTKLFSKDYKSIQAKRFGILHKDSYDVAPSWSMEENTENMTQKFFMKTSIFKKFFTFSMVFFGLALIFAAYIFFGGGNIVSNDNINISILGNAFTAGGEDLPLQIEIENKNNAALELVDMIVEYPKGALNDFSKDTERIRETIGTIPAGRISSNNVKVNLFGEQGSTKPIKVSIEYRLEGSNSIFVKEKDYAVSISSAPINLSVSAPTEISPNQEISFLVKVALNSTRSSSSNILLKSDYPPGFSFTSAVPTPSVGDNLWNLGELAPGAEREIKITGRMVDVEDGEEKSFHFFTGAPDDSDKSVVGVVFNSLAHTILVKKPFIQARLLVNGIYQNEYAASAKTNIQGTIQWVNNLDTKINDVEIRAKITGNALDKRKVAANNGFYDSASDTIIWDKNSYAKFAEINPGDSGDATFSLFPVPIFSSQGILSDPTIKIEISIVGKQPLEGNAINTVNDSDLKTIKIISDLTLANKILYSTGAFTNTGPIPPKAEKETTYTVFWSLSNTANTISNAKVISTLPSFVKFVGTVSPAGEDVKFNPSTREVVWNVGSVARGANITTLPKEVSFQVSINPSLSQIGSIPTLTNDTVLTGHDDFANVDVRVARSSLTTKLLNDQSFYSGSEIVVE